ncbi:ankyrin repeat-containing protein [Burkholderiales bacterium JOSHI_001]|nr:ankyrin repeat-containing protein [Burkholderiales bacterium JOSHI_001]
MMRNYFRKLVYLALVIGFSCANAGAYEDFFRAIDLSDTRTVSQLLARGFDPNSRDEKGQPALVLAVKGDATGIAELLLAHPQLDPGLRNPVGESALMMAALKGNLKLAKALVARGSPLQHEGWTPLHYAASAPDEQVLRLLLDRGVAIDARATNGSTALMMAANYGSEASVKLLLERGADTKARNGSGRSAADFARLAGRDALAAQLDAAGR